MLTVKQINQNNLCIWNLIYQQSNWNWARLWNVQLLESILYLKNSNSLLLTIYIVKFSKGNGKDFSLSCCSYKTAEKREKGELQHFLPCHFLKTENISVSIICFRNLFTLPWHQGKLFIHDRVAERECVSKCLKDCIKCLP